MNRTETTEGKVSLSEDLALRAVGAARELSVSKDESLEIPLFEGSDEGKKALVSKSEDTPMIFIGSIQFQGKTYYVGLPKE